MVLEHPARFKWLSAGRRWRKTTLLMITAVEHVLQGAQLLWVAPTHDQAKIGWAEMYQAAGGVAQFLKQERIVRFPGRGTVLYRSMDDPDHVRGHTADGIIVDEASRVSDVGWYEVLRPIISDTQGWAILASTPRGHNWFAREWAAAQYASDAAAWQIPTLGVRITDGTLVREPNALENPHFPFAEAQKLYETQTETAFRQEFLAEFVMHAGLVYDIPVASVSPAERQSLDAVFGDRPDA